MSRTDPTILVVDDDPDIVRATRHILTGAGLTVVTASTAADALAQARSLRPALLLLDVNLPDGSGVDVAREVKGDPDLADTFVVMASSNRVTAEDQAAGLDQGLADGYIVRPIAGPELLARMHAFLRLHQAQTDLRAALREKDALVREVHHRVKNNLAIVASLLRLEQNRIDHPAARAVLQDMAQRVRSLALLHDLMHQSHHITEVDLGTYLEQLAQRVFRSLAGDTATVRLRLDLARHLVRPAGQRAPHQRHQARLSRWAHRRGDGHPSNRDRSRGRPRRQNPSLPRGARHRRRLAGGLCTPSYDLDGNANRVEPGAPAPRHGRDRAGGRRVFPFAVLRQTLLHDSSERLIMSTTARVLAEVRSQRISQLSAARSACNEAIVRCTSEEELFPKICEAAVTQGGVAMAWVGLIDEVSGQVRPVAWFGAGADDLAAIEVSVDANSPTGRGPTGWAASVGLALTRGGRPAGALNTSGDGNTSR